MRRGRVCGCVVAAATVACTGGAAFGQSIGPSLGTVEFRWRERSTPGYNGSYTLGPGAAPGVDAVPTPDPSAASVTTQDASVMLVLEAKVTQAPGLTGSPIRGLMAGLFDVVTNQTTGGAMARRVVADANPTFNPRPSGRVSTTNLGFDPTTLPGYAGTAPRGTVAPFRLFPESYGPGANSLHIGNVSANNNRINQITLGLQSSLLEPSNSDSEFAGDFALAGLNAWVPVYIVQYTITDVTTERDIVFSITNTTAPTGQPPFTDYQLRTWRGQANPLNGGIDLWQLSPGFTTPPTFTVRVVPAPGVAGLMGVAGLIAAARRRRGRPTGC